LAESDVYSPSTAVNFWTTASIVTDIKTSNPGLIAAGAHDLRSVDPSPRDKVDGRNKHALKLS
jgi:hypothetical protein